MRYIEFFGPSGVGKSTIYEKTLRMPSLRGCVMPERAVLARVHGSRSDIWSRVYWMCNRIVGRPQKRELAAREKSCIQRNQKLARQFWEAVNDLRGAPPYEIDTRLLMAKNILSALVALEAISFSQSAKVCVVDEGFYQRLLGLTSPLLTEDRMESLLEQGAKPSGLVACRAPVEVIVDRLAHRGRIAASMLGMGRDACMAYARLSCEMTNRLIDIARRNHVPVCTIDTANDVQHNLDKIAAFITETLGQSKRGMVRK